MTKPFSFRHKYRSDLIAIKGPWLVEGPHGFSFELLDRTDAALLARKLNDVGTTEAEVLTKKLIEPSRPKRHHSTRKSAVQLDGEIQAVLDYAKSGKPEDIERWVDDWLRQNRGKDWARTLFAKEYAKAIRSSNP